MKPHRRSVTCLLLVATTLLPLPAAAETVPLAALSQRTHFHGIAADPRAPGHLFLATHHGFYRVAPDGQASRLSTDRNDYMGFTPHPNDAGILYATGHPAGGGNMGFIHSTDGGRRWEQLSPGVGGPVDFHQMAVSRADPAHIYGVYAGRLQHSADGGKSWEVVAPAPAGLIGLAASAQTAGRLYAATQKGLQRSDDGGLTWRPAHLFRQPATLVYSAPSGAVYAFTVGRGLLRTAEPQLGWRPVGGDWGERYLLHLAEDPRDPQILYAITGEGGVLVSRDGGGNWSAFGAQ